MLSLSKGNHLQIIVRWTARIPLKSRKCTIPSHIEGESSLYIYSFPIMIQDIDEEKYWLEWQVSVTQCSLSTHSTLFPISSPQSCPWPLFCLPASPPPTITPLASPFPQVRRVFLSLRDGEHFFFTHFFFQAFILK